MATCPHCDATVPDGARYCNNCAAAQPQGPSPESTSPKESSDNNISVRLEKAMRRAELLSYAAAGLGIAILALIIGIAFL